MITTKIIFDRKHQAKKDGTGTIEIRVTVARHAIYISTGVRVCEKEWKAGRVVNRTDAPALNERIGIIYEIVDREANRCIKVGQPINTAAIKKMVWNEKDAMSDEPSFLEWFEHQTEILNLSHGTVKHYISLRTRLVEFGKIKQWADVTTENISEFDAWLHKRKLSTGEAITDAAVYKYHKCLKAILNRADKFGKIERNPYERLKGVFKRGERENVEYLTEEEMRKFEAMVLPTGSPLDIAHDLFIFQAYTGLPYSDMQAFDINDYKWDGTKWNSVGNRIKTGVPYVSSILPPALHVLEKYNFEIPKMNNSDYNKQLKALQTMAGIKTRLHSHLARHTFATYMLRNGAKIENVSKMLGHTNITQTQRYAKVLAQSVHEDFDMIAEKISGKAAVTQQHTKHKKSKSKK